MGDSLEQWRASIGNWARGNTLRVTTGGRELFSFFWYKLLVILVLLIIAGVEKNPGPLQVVQRYKKTVGATNMSGELFEVKMLTLLFLRGLNSQQEFRIASNMAIAGSFDDVVFTLGHHTAFLQLKHRQRKETKVYMPHLLTIRGDFSLLKYYKSYLEVKRQWKKDKDLQNCGSFEDSVYIVFTNAKLNVETDINVGSSGMQDLLNAEGKLIKFTKEKHENIYQVFENLPRYKQLLSDAVSNDQIPDTPELLEVVRKLQNNNAKCIPDKKDLVKLLDELKPLGDFSGYRDFLSQLWFCTEQAGENELDNLIKSELQTLFGNDTYFLELKIGIENWWRKSNVYLTDQANFFQGIIQKIAANITKDIPILKVKFVQNERDNIRHIFSPGNRKLYLKTDCTSLSYIKVLQSFQTYLMVDVNILQTHLNEVLAVWRLGLCEVLVIEGETSDIGILQKLGNMPDLKFLVVISNMAVHMELYKKFQFITFTDTFSLSQLDTDSQGEILNCEVMFQGSLVKLNSLADISFFQRAVTADVVVQLHQTLQIGNKLDDLDPCYISRTFLRREYVNQQIFREKHIIFAVTGISKDTLASLVPNGEEVQKFNAENIVKDRICRYFLIEGEDEFTALCESNNNIHWIHASEGSFIWKMSKGDLSSVLNHLEQKFVSYAGAEEVVGLPHQVVLVIAEPGMGKSTEMCNIAHIIKQKDPSTWVMMVNLNQHINLLSQDQVNAVQFLETVAALNTEFQKCLFEHQLESCGNVAILLDGFDEISPNYSDRVLSLLKEFAMTKIKNVLVTSRPVMKKELQQKLSTLAFSFHMFTPNDQENFLIRYWNQSSVNSPQLPSFISSLLQLVEASINDRLRELTGIPLQTRMLAEVFKDEALHYCHTGDIRLPVSLDVLQIYDRFVDKKWEVFYKKVNIDVKKANDVVKCYMDQIQQSFMSCALVSYLDYQDIKRLQDSENILKQNNEYIERFKSCNDKTGIVIDIINEKAVFVHRTFTEYFVAMWYSKNFILELDIIKNKYFNQNFEIIQKFLDRMLAREFKLHTAVLNKNGPALLKLLSEKTADVNREDNSGRTALHLAIMNYFNRKDKINEDSTNDSILQILLKHGADINSKDRAFHWSPLQLAENIRAWSVVERLLENQADSTDLVLLKTDIEKQLSVQNTLQAAKGQDFYQHIKSNSKYEMSELLHNAVYTSIREGYVNLAEFIFKSGVSVNQHITNRGVRKTPMLHIAVEHRQLRLMQCLLKQGADVNSRDKHGDTALSLAARKGNKEIVELLLQEGADVEITGKYNRTPLMKASASGHVQVVQLLVNHGASVNARDKEGRTALSSAAREREIETVELLLRNGAKVDISDRFDRTPLMWAAERGHVQIVEVLINHRASLNERDENGCTALSLAASKGKNETVELLLRKGANVEIYDEDKITPLMKAAEGGHIQTVVLLINNGAFVNAKDKNGNSALMVAALEGIARIVELLLQKGADINITDKYFNRTPMMQASECGHIEVAKLLINHGADINAIDACGDTALSIAARKGINEIVELLLQNRCDIISGRYGRTPLMQAAEFGHKQTLDLLINYGVPVNQRNHDGDTALLIAANEGLNEIVELLLQRGADVEISDVSFNRTPLMWAADHGHMQVVELLINHEASVDARNTAGESALTLAVNIIIVTLYSFYYKEGLMLRCQI